MEEIKILWFSLHLLLGINLKLINKLRKKFNSVKEIFEAKREDLLNLGLEREKVEMIISGEIVTQTSEQLSEAYKKGYQILAIDDKDYPSLLKEIYDRSLTSLNLRAISSTKLSVSNPGDTIPSLSLPPRLIYRPFKPTA